jgi:hypothetical protein
LAGITSAALALGLGLAPALTVQADETAFQISLPTTTVSLGLPTITLTTDILTTLTLLTTTLPSTSVPTILPSSTTTAPLSTTAPATSVTPAGAPASTAPSTTTTRAEGVMSVPEVKPSSSNVASDLRGGFVSTPTTVTSTRDFGDLVVTAPTWERVRSALLPLFSPRILDVVLSPLLIFEIVLGALLRSGQMILLPLAILGSLFGVGLVRGLPRFREIYQGQVPLSFLRDRGNS